MADVPRLQSPIVRVVMDDGAEWEVQTLNPDLLRWDMTAPKHKWGKAEEVPMLWVTFIAWHASKREGLTSLTWELFQNAAIEVTTVNPGEPMDPTNPAHEDG